VPTHAPPGPVNNHPELVPPSPTCATLAAAGGSEEFILSWGIRNRSDFNAAMSRTAKSPELVAALATYAVVNACLGAERSQIILDVLAEPNLPLDSLLWIAAVVHQLGFDAPALLAGLLAHPGCSDDVVIEAFWGADQLLVEAVARATGLLLPLAVAYVSAHLVGTYTPVSDHEIAQIHAVHGRWTRWAAQDQSRTTFLLSSALRFTDEDDMFAAGDAFAGQPAHVRP